MRSDLAALADDMETCCCQTTECLRNYILAYFSNIPAAPASATAGSCNNDFDEVDMTDAAKWMIDCIAAELRGSTAKQFLFGTLQGAKPYGPGLGEPS